MAPFGSRVRFAGAVPHGELPALYASADLYLWPAINEAYGMAFLEAQAAGLPVVAGRTGGVPAVVADGVTGLLTPIGDAVSFAAAVARLLEDQDRARLGAAAAQRVAAHHDERAAAHALGAALATLRGEEMRACPSRSCARPDEWNAGGRLQGLTDTRSARRRGGGAAMAAARRPRLEADEQPVAARARTAELCSPRRLSSITPCAK